MADALGGARWEVREGDCLEVLRRLPDCVAQLCVTSPPYWALRSYLDGDDPLKSFELGSERIPDCLGWATMERCGECFVCNLVAVFREVRRVLRDDGCAFVNLGDSYTSGGRDTHGTREGFKQQTNRGMSGENDPARAPQPPGLKPKDLCMIPARVALALQADGWYLRSDIIWHKPNPMPESVTDRPTSAHEHVFLLAKSGTYWYDANAVAEESIHAGKVVTLGEKSLSRGQANGAGVEASGNGLADAVTVTPTRNLRNVWTADEPLVRLRGDLSEADRSFVLAELARRGLHSSRTDSSDDRPE